MASQTSQGRTICAQGFPARAAAAVAVSRTKPIANSTSLISTHAVYRGCLSLGG